MGRNHHGLFGQAIGYLNRGEVRDGRFHILPPDLATELAKAALGEAGLKAYGSMTALQHMGDPAEVGAAAAFLASSDSSFMTASEVAVDGGLAQL